MEKRVLTKYKKLPVEIKAALKREYPNGFDNILTTIKLISNGESVSALIYTYNDTQYLIKYTRNKNIDQRIESDDELENSLGGEWFEYEN
ncbi:MAG: hypothetical protein ACPGSO_02450 [Vicingaceae bacterium]